MYTPDDALLDEKVFLQMAAVCNGDNQLILAGLFSVEASNCLFRVGMLKAHKPNLGPYSSSNPCVCMDCGKFRSDWKEGEECVPADQ